MKNFANIRAISWSVISAVLLASTLGSTSAYAAKSEKSGGSEGSESSEKAEKGKKSKKAKKPVKKTVKKEQPTPPPTQEMTIAVPQPGLELRSPAPQPKAIVDGTRIEVSASTWRPKPFTTDSYLAETSEFNSDETPTLSINAGRRWTNAGDLAVATNFGLSYDRLVRSGQLSLPTTQSTMKQSMNLYSGRLGLEMTLAREMTIAPFLQTSLLATWMQAQASSFNSGESRFVYSLEAVGGAIWNVPSFASFLGMRSLAFELGVVGTQGIKDSPLTGLGILFGTRVEL